MKGDLHFNVYLIDASFLQVAIFKNDYNPRNFLPIYMYIKEIKK